MRSLDPRPAGLVTSTRAARPSRAALGRAAAAGVVAALLSGCTLSYPLNDPPGDDIPTGSVRASDVATPAPAEGAVTSRPLAAPADAAPAAAAPPATPVAYAPTKPPAEQPGITPADWSYARGALSLAMGADAVNASVPWANPDTGAYGSFSAIAAPAVENGATCRPFAASHSASGREQRLEGTACRTAAGHWEAVAIRTTASRTL